MKVQKINKYTFEEGDIVVNRMYNWVAIKVANSYGWKHTNGEEAGHPQYFNDQQVEDLLEANTWKYVGNRQVSEDW